MIQCLISLVCWHIACNCEFYRIVQTFCLLHFRYALHVWGYRTTPSLAHLWTALSCSAACWPKLTFSGQIGFVACLIKFSAFRNTWHHVFLCRPSSHEKKNPPLFPLYFKSRRLIFKVDHVDMPIKCDMKIRFCFLPILAETVPSIRPKNDISG